MSIAASAVSIETPEKIILRKEQTTIVSGGRIAANSILFASAGLKRRARSRYKPFEVLQLLQAAKLSVLTKNEKLFDKAACRVNSKGSKFSMFEMRP